ncbi:plasma membrane iron permease [Colletotrichum orchidophilum]|uniref:Plasma membrane iron permease n=1 Tax=Colletotrichum orchidophilum TaxID=1209926 RepID=A0A1G4B0P3_9PEZI|nr:plasma membrane iron permease [Colletotrichum orchidophilum]OHE94905.1 plasma membrane iron permease [Colletotrichum orchidophilum]
MGCLRTVGASYDSDIGGRLLVSPNIPNRRLYRFLHPPKCRTASNSSGRECHLAAWLCPDPNAAEHNPDADFTRLNDRSTHHADGIKHGIATHSDRGVFSERYHGDDDEHEDWSWCRDRGYRLAVRGVLYGFGRDSWEAHEFYSEGSFVLFASDLLYK